MLHIPYILLLLLLFPLTAIEQFKIKTNFEWDLPEPEIFPGLSSASRNSRTTFLEELFPVPLAVLNTSTSTIAIPNIGFFIHTYNSPPSPTQVLSRQHIKSWPGSRIEWLGGNPQVTNNTASNPLSWKDTTIPSNRTNMDLAGGVLITCVVVAVMCTAFWLGFKGQAHFRSEILRQEDRNLEKLEPLPSYLISPVTCNSSLIDHWHVLSPWSLSVKLPLSTFLPWTPPRVTATDFRFMEAANEHPPNRRQACCCCYAGRGHVWSGPMRYERGKPQDTDTEHPHGGTPTVAEDLERMPIPDEEDPFGVWIRWTNMHEPGAKLDEATHPIVPP